MSREISPPRAVAGREFSAFSPFCPCRRVVVQSRWTGLARWRGFAFSVVIPISFSEPVVFREPVSWPSTRRPSAAAGSFCPVGRCVSSTIGPQGERHLVGFSKRHQAKRMGCVATIVLSETLWPIAFFGCPRGHRVNNETYVPGGT
jgi:hypothetical protein